MTTNNHSPAPTSEAVPTSLAPDARIAGDRQRSIDTLASLPTAVQPSELDRLATKGIASTVAFNDSGNMRDYHGLELLGLAAELLKYTPAQAASPFGQGNTQRLFGALLAYQRHFAPDEHWKLVHKDPATATLVWRCQSADLPDVVDAITRTSRLAALAHPDEIQELYPASSYVIRECDLTNPRDSRLSFPGEHRPAVWCPADDPIRMRELAFPNPVPAPTEGHVVKAHHPGSRGLVGLDSIAGNETGFVTAASARSPR